MDNSQIPLDHYSIKLYELSKTLCRTQDLINGLIMEVTCVNVFTARAIC